MKILKKVISAVIAMAIAGSMIPASFAAKVNLTDVADTASYATAVNTLVALGIIDGYEDDTFRPDNAITRAEAAKVVAAALNMTEAADSLKGATGFVDVADDFWANGFINVGVKEEIINGMDGNRFAPNDNVTYAQIVKMLVVALGYEEMAQYLGGWEAGAYTDIGDDEGVTKGVTANDNDPATRAQVAQLVYNALNTPIVTNTDYKRTDSGKLVPDPVKNDAKDGEFYKTLLTEKFNAYLVEGYVTQTAKDGIAGIEKDEVTFGVAKTQKYDSQVFGLEYMTDKKNVQSFADAAKNNVTVNVGDTDAADYKGVYATAIIAVDEYEDNVMLYFQPSGKNKTAKVDVDLVDEYKEDENNLYVYASENSTKTQKYPLATATREVGGSDVVGAAVNVYVNGFPVCKATDSEATIETAIATYVEGASIGEVELVDTYKTDGYYDAIYVESYLTAMVKKVVTASNDLYLQNVKLAGNISAFTQITLDTEADEDLEYKIILDGEEITLAELKEDDVLSIVCDVTKSDIATCDDLTIYVSRNVQTGKFTGKNASEKTVTIGGQQYTFVADGDILADSNLGKEYTIYIDIFGRILKTELNASNVNYAIVNKILDDTGNQYDGKKRVQLYTADGAQKTYVVEDDATIVTESNEIADTWDAFETAIETAVGTPVKEADLAPIQNRVISYTVKSKTGYINSINLLAPEGTADGTKEYDAAAKDINNIYFGDATKIVDAMAYYTNYESTTKKAAMTDLKVGSLDALVDEVKYTAYAYAEENGVHSFVIITAGKAAYNETTRFAVVAGKPGTEYTEDEEIIVTIPAYDAKATELQSLIAGEDAKVAAAALNIGDVFVYQIGTDGYIDEIKVLFKSTDGDRDTYKELADAVIAGTDLVGSLTGFDSAWIKDWNKGKGDNKIQLLTGIVLEDDVDSYIYLADVAASATNKGNDQMTDGGVYRVRVNDSTAVYTYNFEKSDKQRVATGDVTSIIGTVLADDNTTIDWTNANNKKNIKLAFALVVDGTASDILYITGNYNA